MQSNAVLAENAALRSQIQEHQAHAAALQDQSAEQSRTISLGSLQLKQMQSKVRPDCTHGFLETKLQALPHVLQCTEVLRVQGLSCCIPWRQMACQKT